MKDLEISGKTVEEATRKALAELGVGSDEVDIRVINPGRSGILGIGAEDARIRVRVISPPQAEEETQSQPGARPGEEPIFEEEKQPEDESTRAIKAILAELVEKLGIQATIDEKSSSVFGQEDPENRSLILNISGRGADILIGRKGQTLDALQYILRLMVAKQTGLRTPIILDVEDYRQRRYEDLRTLATNVAAQVKAKRSAIKLEPMSAFERRIVHLTLADDPEVTTESIGEGDSRKVMILLKR
jgi:spoIIIJ-associated protein